MRKVVFCLGMASVVIIVLLWADNTDLRTECKTQRNNVAALMEDVEDYRVEDSLQAASVAELQLTLSEYKRYRAEDAALIEKMKVDIKRLKSVTSVQEEAVYSNTAVLSEDNGTDSIDVAPKERKAEYGDEWHRITMLIKSDSVEYTLRTTESLLITSHVIPKHFLFFKFGCKEIRTDVVSRNPYTQKINVDNVTLRK